MNRIQHVKIYTNGISLGNPGPGGYASILVYGNHRKEISGGFEWTTNDRMAIMAVIVGLKALNRKCQVTIYSYSKYLLDSALNKWIVKWKSNKLIHDKNNRELNIDLWEELLKLCVSHNVTFEWINGHDADSENERCKQLAITAAKGLNLLIDEGCIKLVRNQANSHLKIYKGYTKLVRNPVKERPKLVLAPVILHPKIVHKPVNRGPKFTFDKPIKKRKIKKYFEWWEY